MTIELKTKLFVTFHNPEHERMAEVLAALVDKKLKDERYEKRINEILVEAGQECFDELSRPS